MSTPLPVAFQGEPGANGDIASRLVFPDRDTLPCLEFEDVFSAVESGAAEYALIPIDNSIAGRVAMIHTLLPHATTHIIGEHFQPIEHVLLGLPGATLESVKKVRSHVHALAQCRKFIAQHGFQAEVAQDTAGAAREVSELGDPTIAALAPALAGELYGLIPLAAKIADHDENVTRFLVLSLTEQMPPNDGRPVITSLFFRLKSVPAALYNAIGGFAKDGINLLKLESYLGEHFQTAFFYIEALGHPENERMHDALEILKSFSEEVRILGTYPASPFREGIH